MVLEGQGGIIVAMTMFPLILERACRDRAVTLHQMATFRQSWSAVNAILVIDPVILPVTNVLHTAVIEFLNDAGPCI